MQSIVDYESSDEEEQVNVGVKRAHSLLDSSSEKSSKMPKLPAFFMGTVKDIPPATTTTENKTDHQNRLRTVPHRTNSWATYVYFQVDLAEDKKTILQHCNGLEEIEEQHISLSRTVYLKQHELDSFVNSIRSVTENLPSFDLSFAQIAQLTNDEKTRSFVTLEVGSGYNELVNCLKQVDQVMRKFNQPVFYDPPRFHTSIAWSLNENDIKKLNIPSSCIDDMMNNHFHLSKLFVKQGHLISHIELK